MIAKTFRSHSSGGRCRYIACAIKAICAKQCFIICRLIHVLDRTYQVQLGCTLEGVFERHDKRVVHLHDARHWSAKLTWHQTPAHCCSTSAIMVLSVITRSTCLALGFFFFLITCMHTCRVRRPQGYRSHYQPTLSAMISPDFRWRT